MILGENIGSVYSNGREIKRVFSKGKLVWEKEDIDYSVRPFTIKAIDDNVSINAHNMEYYSYAYVSINDSDWVMQYVKDITLNKNDTISFKSTEYIYYFEINGLSDIYGNIMSLMYGDDFIGQTDWKWNHSLAFGLFSRCDIRHAKNLILPAINGCYNSMFYYCTNLISAPNIQATETSDFCYQAMFYGCSSLISPPKIIPSQQMKHQSCSQMFYGCSSLISAPELPALRLRKGCYESMFKNCSSLNYIKCNATEIETYTLKDCIGNWLSGVSDTGTFVCNRDTTIEIDEFCPYGWTLEYFT